MIPDFDNASRKAKELLLIQDIRSFRLNVRHMKFFHDIQFDSFENYSKLVNMPVSELTVNGKLWDGYVLNYGDAHLVLYGNGDYNDAVSKKTVTARRFGYRCMTKFSDRMSDKICGKHFSYDGFNHSPQGLRLNWTLAHEVGHVMLEHERDDELSEIEAHFFAAELLIPEPVLVEVSKRIWNGYFPVHEISDVFGVSKEVSERRAATLRKKGFISEYLCREVLEKYQMCFDNHLLFA